jgi:hypothetical protein
MTHTKDEALKLALDALETWKCGYPREWDAFDEEAITAIKQALAQPAPVQPVASMSDEQDAFEKVFKLPDGITRFDGGYAPTSYSAWSAQQNCYRWEGWKARSKLCATPPAAQPAPVPLTNEEISAIGSKIFPSTWNTRHVEFARAIEAKLKEKNT